MLSQFSKDFLTLHRDQIKFHNCPGEPHPGACEFCRGTCHGATVFGRILTEDEYDFVFDLFQDEWGTEVNQVENFQGAFI